MQENSKKDNQIALLTEENNRYKVKLNESIEPQTIDNEEVTKLKQHLKQSNAQINNLKEKILEYEKSTREIDIALVKEKNDHMSAKKTLQNKQSELEEKASEINELKDKIKQIEARMDQTYDKNENETRISQKEIDGLKIQLKS